MSDHRPAPGWVLFSVIFSTFVSGSTICMHLGLHMDRYRSVQGWGLLCGKPSKCHLAASSMEISLFWLCSFRAASVCNHIEMLYFRAATRGQNIPRHPVQAGLPHSRLEPCRTTGKQQQQQQLNFSPFNLAAARCACSGMLLQKSPEHQVLSVFSCP